MSSMVQSGSSGASAYYQGKAEQSIWDRNVQMVGYEGQMQEEASRESTKQLLGQQKALYAKAGVDMSSGSPLLVMTDTAAKGELEAQRIKWKTKDSQSMYNWYAHLAHKAGKAGATTGIVSGAITLASMIAGGIGGAAAAGAAGTSTTMGAIGGAMSAGSGGASQGWGSLIKAFSTTPNYGLGGK